MSVVALDLSSCREGLGSMRRSGMQSWHERGGCAWEDLHWFVSSDKDSALTRFFAPTQFSVPLKLKLVSQHRAPCCDVATCCLPIKATLSGLGTLSKLLCFPWIHWLRRVTFWQASLPCCLGRGKSLGDAMVLNEALGLEWCRQACPVSCTNLEWRGTLHASEYADKLVHHMWQVVQTSSLIKNVHLHHLSHSV